MGYKLKRIMMRPNGVEKQVRPSGWQPGEDTILYCPFDGNSNNYANNGYTMSAANTPITYSSIGSIQVGYFQHGGVYTNVSNVSELTGSLTYNIWIKTGQNTQFGDTIIEAGTEDNSRARYLQTQGDINTKRYRAAFWYSDLDTPNNSLVLDTWQNVVMTLDGSTRARCIYINGVLSANDTANTDSFTKTQIGIGVIASLGSGAGVTDTYLSKVIVEKKCWTATEISDYYNLTKGDYGIS